MPRRKLNDEKLGIDVISLAEAATRLGKHPDTYEKAMQLGQAPGYRFGNGYVIPKRWFERYLNGDWTPGQQGETA